MTDSTEPVLQLLVGKPIVAHSRVVDLEAFAFGESVHSQSAHGKMRIVPEYALHVQCPWRILQGDRIIVGYRDMADPPTGASRSDFDPNEARTTRRDELMDRFITERSSEPRRVVAATWSSRGDGEIVFDDRCVLELFPDASFGGSDTEHWRLVLPTREHLVMSSHGLDRVPAASS